MSTCFFVEEIIEAVSSIAKKICLLNSLLNKDMI